MSETTIEKLNGERPLLAPRLPLKVPFSISITTANVCNLKCEFCAHAENNEKNKPFLSLEDFTIAMDNLIRNNWHLKQIVLVGLGEPLLNRNIVDFVKYIKTNDIADKVHIVTNGIFLTHEMSDNLINAGLDVLRLSINGLSGKDYLVYTGVEINYKQLLDNIKYYFETKTQVQKSYVKIMDYMVNTEDKKELFNAQYGNICDVTNIEYLTEMSTTLDYNEIDNELNKVKGLKGFSTVSTCICPLPMYHTYLNADITLSACCVAGPWYTPPALIMGDLRNQEISEIWNSKSVTDFFITMLRKGKNEASDVCKKCKAYLSYIYPEDKIDDEATRIANDLEKGLLK